MLTFTDDFSRYTTAYFIKSKSEVLSKFMEYVNSAEKHTAYHISKLNILSEEDVKVLRSDNGGEYTSNNFAKFCAEKGISHEFTVPYCPQQNGVAERMNRTIMEGARSMLYPATLPLEFWAEACSTAVYLHNRSPTTALKDKTPFESLFRRRPDISQLKILNEEPAAPEQVEPPDQKNEEPVVPESVKPPVPKDVESAVPQNVEAVGHQMKKLQLREHMKINLWKKFET